MKLSKNKGELMNNELIYYALILRENHSSNPLRHNNYLPSNRERSLIVPQRTESCQLYVY